ncbi:MAG: FHA domain-containing protein [Bacteriovoracaceae bacterium]
MSNDNATLVIKDIKAALASSDKEAESKPAALLAIGGDLNGTVFDLLPGDLIIGRNADCNVMLDFDGISRQHFKIIMNGDSSSATLSDLNSSNGTFLNNNKITSDVLLKKGDIIKVGAIALKYLPKGDTERLTYDKLHLDANTDRFTGAYNKTYFNKALDLEVKKVKLLVRHYHYLFST